MVKYMKLRNTFCPSCKQKTIHERGGSMSAGYWWTCTKCQKVAVKT